MVLSLRTLKKGRHERQSRGLAAHCTAATQNVNFNVKKRKDPSGEAEATWLDQGVSPARGTACYAGTGCVYAVSLGAVIRRELLQTSCLCEAVPARAGDLESSQVPYVLLYLATCTEGQMATGREGGILDPLLNGTYYCHIPAKRGLHVLQVKSMASWLFQTQNTANPLLSAFESIGREHGFKGAINAGDG